MKKMIAACLALVLGIPVVGLLSSGCGSSNNATAPAPVTVTFQPTPYTGAQYGYTHLNTGGDGPLPSGQIYAEAITIAATSKTLSLSLRTGSAASGTGVLFVYNDNSNYPNALMDYGVINSLILNQWNSAPLNNVSLAPGVYWIGYSSVNSILVWGTNTLNFFDITAAYANPPASTMPGGGAVSSPTTGFAMVLDTTF